MIGRLALSGLILVLFLGLGRSADAAPMNAMAGFEGLDIDFRSEAFASDCLHRSSCTKSPGDLSTRVTVAAGADTRLYWDDTDGFGILGGENDEIDGSEQLTISFQQGTPFALSGIALTDLFMPTDGGPRGEEALVQFFFNDEEVGPAGGMRFDQADDNIYGASLFSLDEILKVDKIVFSSTGDFNDEYSVAGLSGVLQSDPDLPAELPPEVVSTLPPTRDTPRPAAPPSGDGNVGQTPENDETPGTGGPDGETEPGEPTAPPQTSPSPIADQQPQPVSAPATLLLILAGLAGLFGLRRSCRPA
ncbi:MAG: PEP-CTERM sorting domain-containing protein [Alphaproteobacteria bacterium]|jgi:hypothetical protein|nr:PEP-CTERM sorting domain-containing protein [Alphaproteobacteria bacterium]